MTYDAQNRMKTASCTGGSGRHLLEYTYERNNLLAEKKTDNSVLTSTTKYL